jgi:hypothetical protein
VQALAFGAILTATLANLFGQMMCARPRVGLKSLDQTLGNRTFTIDEPLLEFGDRLGKKLFE